MSRWEPADLGTGNEKQIVVEHLLFDFLFFFGVLGLLNSSLFADLFLFETNTFCFAKILTSDHKLTLPAKFG